MEKWRIKQSPVVKEEFDNSVEYKQCIYDFINKMKHKHDLSAFYRNIKTLEIIPIDKFELPIQSASAGYNIDFNTIVYEEDRLNIDIMHELFHVATTKELDDRFISGFYQITDNNKTIGIGLNEGYTALMDERYFMDYDSNKLENSKNVYSIEKYICVLLEGLIGEEEMEDYYMDANLHDLVLEISEYSDRRSAHYFIQLVDKYYKERETKKHPNALTICRTYSKILYFIAECYLTKAKTLYNNRTISREDYETYVDYVKWLLDQNLHYHKIFRSRKMSKDFDGLNKTVENKIKK